MPKYLVKARIVVEGIVEKPDVIGAIFGQTEGLLGDQLDLRQLQEKGRIGRIIVDIKTHGTKTVGEIIIPSNLDRIETALIAAMIESVDKVGPYPAKIEVVDIIDVRLEKIRKIVERAKQILTLWGRQKTPDIKEILHELEKVVKIPEVVKYGPEHLPAGPDVDKSDTLIIVEGRADVVNLLRYGYTNVIALGGAKPRIPETIINLTKSKKKVIVFVDGDHAGDLILKEILRSNMKIDYIARAPPGKEVEELTRSEIEEALKKAIPVKEYLEQIRHRKPQLRLEERVEKPAEAKIEGKKPVQIQTIEEVISIPKTIVDDIKGLSGTLEAILYDKEWKPVKRIPVRDLVNTVHELDPDTVTAIVFDGIVTQRLVDAVKEKNIKVIIGAKLGNITHKPSNVLILSFSDVF
ncbi:MAG: DNA primase [Thermoprotei archaeon]|nr:MAG: DNA primase [Thermoprotei archaeon]